jgi:hypothetical protein
MNDRGSHPLIGGEANFMNARGRFRDFTNMSENLIASGFIPINGSAPPVIASMTWT